MNFNCCDRQDNANINLQGSCCSVMECPQEKCCQRIINHQVDHIIPINTRIINKHVYNHQYIPVYTCTEENIVEPNRCSMRP